MKKTLILLTLLAAATSLSACNTFEGLGQDIQSGGKKIEKTAGSNKSY